MYVASLSQVHKNGTQLKETSIAEQQLEWQCSFEPKSQSWP